MEFKDAVLRAVAKIPKGGVSTYKDVAAASGRPLAARAVGNILRENFGSRPIPCHRVVKSGGRLGGYAKGERKKIEILRSEGVAVKNGRVVDFKKVLRKF